MLDAKIKLFYFPVFAGKSGYRKEANKVIPHPGCHSNNMNVNFTLFYFVNLLELDNVCQGKH